MLLLRRDKKYKWTKTIINKKYGPNTSKDGIIELRSVSSKLLNAILFNTSVIKLKNKNIEIDDK